MGNTAESLANGVQVSWQKNKTGFNVHQDGDAVAIRVFHWISQLHIESTIARQKICLITHQLVYVRQARLKNV